MSQIHLLFLIIAFSFQYIYATEHEEPASGTETITRRLEKEITGYSIMVSELERKNASQNLKDRWAGLKDAYVALLDDYKMNNELDVEGRIALIHKRYSPFSNKAAVQ